MASPELTDDQNAHLRALMKAALPRYQNSVNQLALRLEMAATSLGKFLKGLGGASKDTARRFAQLEGKAYEEVIGDASAQRVRSIGRPPGQAFPPTPKALKIARTWLAQKPLEITADAIDYALADTFLTNSKDADSPQAVREALLHTMFGSVVHLPRLPSGTTPVPSTIPPAGTRRSRMRGR